MGYSKGVKGYRLINPILSRDVSFLENRLNRGQEETISKQEVNKFLPENIKVVESNESHVKEIKKKSMCN